MRCVRNLVCYTVSVLVFALLLGGCETTQQPNVGEGRQALLKKIKTQQTEIDELERRVEAATNLLLGIGAELEKCKVKLHTAKKDNENTTVGNKAKSAENKSNKPTAVKKRPKITSRSKPPKRKSGCPCKRKTATSRR